MPWNWFLSISISPYIMLAAMAKEPPASPVRRGICKQLGRGKDGELQNSG